MGEVAESLKAFSVSQTCRSCLDNVCGCTEEVPIVALKQQQTCVVQSDAAAIKLIRFGIWRIAVTVAQDDKTSTRLRLDVGRRLLRDEPRQAAHVSRPRLALGLAEHSKHDIVAVDSGHVWFSVASRA